MTEANKVGNWIFFQKPIELLLFLLQQKEPINQHRMHMQVNISYSSIADIVRKMEEVGVVMTKVEGRDRKVSLTEKGKEVGSLLKRIKEKVGVK